MSALQLLFVFAVAISAAAATLPSYVTVCPKNDPQLDKCFSNSLDKMRPHLKEGIPELGVPALEPLEFFELKPAQFLGDWNQVLLKNLKIRGAGEYRITRFNINLIDTEFSGGIYIPNLNYESDYSLDVNFMQLSMKGEGTVKGNATECFGDFVLRGHQDERNGRKYFHFKKMNIYLNIDRVHVSIAGLINGDLLMGDAVHDNTGADLDLWQLLKPVIEETISDVVLELVNNIAKNTSVDEIFP